MPIFRSWALMQPQQGSKTLSASQYQSRIGYKCRKGFYGGKLTMLADIAAGGVLSGDLV